MLTSIAILSYFMVPGPCWEIACCGMPRSLPPLLRGPSAAATVATARRVPRELALSMLRSSEAMHMPYRMKTDNGSTAFAQTAMTQTNKMHSHNR